MTVVGGEVEGGNWFDELLVGLGPVAEYLDMRKTVHDRHRRWSADGTWEKVLRAIQVDADAEGRIDWSMVSVDSTSCRAHQHAAGTRSSPPNPGKAQQAGSAPIK